MAFNTKGAATGAASGASTGMMFGPKGAAVGAVAGGLMGGFMGGGDEVKKPNMDAQRGLLRQGIQDQTLQTNDLGQNLDRRLNQYRADASGLNAEQGAELNRNMNMFKADNTALTDATKLNLTKQLASNTFGGVQDMSRGLRENAAAGAGLDSGAYQQGASNLARDTTRQLIQGQTAIEQQGLQGQQAANTVAYQTFSDLSAKLGAQKMETLVGIAAQGDANATHIAGLKMGLSQQETQGLIDMANQEQGLELASSAANAQNQQAMLSSMMNSGGSLLGQLGKAYASNKTGKPAGPVVDQKARDSFGMNR